MAKKENGRRLSMWVGVDERWLIEMLDKRVTTSQVLGEDTSRAKEMFKILEETLREDYIVDYGQYPNEKE